MSEMIPIDADCQTDWAITPVNTNVVTSTPPGWPYPAWRVGPRRRTRVSGRAKSAKIRSRSRSSLTRSRCAMTRTADTSLIPLDLRARDELHVGVLQARRLGPAAGRAEAGRRPVEEQDLGAVHQAADDLELPPHPA